MMQVLDLGLKSYEEVWALQKELTEKRALGEIEDTLILVEHLPVYTLGRSASADKASKDVDEAIQSKVQIKKLGEVPVLEIERGGKITFHGPGQLVGYPIFALEHRDLRRYLRDLERVLVGAIQDETLLSVKPCPENLLLEPGQLQTGVWIRDHKLASIGIAVRKWVSYHGFALNVSTDLRYFQAVEPCGFNGSIMTSLKKELGSFANIDSLTSNLKKNLADRFQRLSFEYQNAHPAIEEKSNLIPVSVD